MLDNKALIDPKESKYETYRQLKYQEEINPKHKFDNRLYVTLRYKIYNYNIKHEDEIFKKNFNRETIYRAFVYQRNKYWVRRYEILNENMFWGTNKYGVKKFFKLERFHEHPKHIYMSVLFAVGFNIAYFGLALYYNKLSEDVWMHAYGDYVPTYEVIAHYTIRTAIRKITYYLCYWKLISSYYFNKYDVTTVQFSTGYPMVMATESYVRKKEYNRRRDETFDFMQIGESDFEDFTDNFV